MTSKKAEPKSKTIRVGSVSITAYPWQHPSGAAYWRFAYQDRAGKRKFITRADRAELIDLARNKAREIHNGNFDLTILSDEQARLCRAFLELNPTWQHIATLRETASAHSITVAAALTCFHETKNANRGLSGRNTTTLRKNLNVFSATHGERILSGLTKSDIDQWLVSLKKTNGDPLAPRTRLNFRRSLVTFFLWAQKSGYVPPGETAAALSEKPIVEDKEPLTLTPKEYKTMLEAVSQQYAPWLILGGFMGFRHEELYPEAGSRKPGLTWEDFQWKEGLVIVPKAVSKTRRRIVPIPEAVITWLNHHGHKLANLTGRCCTGKPPAKTSHKIESETKRLGNLIGGWRPNCLRDSFISYRAAQIGLGQTAMEAGNSESEAKKSYLHAMSEADATAFFDLRP